MIHLRDDVMVTENFSIFIELLTEANSYCLFIAGTIDDGIGIVYLFSSGLCIFFDVFLVICEIIDALFYLCFECVVDKSEE